METMTDDQGTGANVRSADLGDLIGMEEKGRKGGLTPVGKLMAGARISRESARMLLAGARLGVVRQVEIIVACVEAGDIRAFNRRWTALTQERRSDLLAMLDVYEAGNDDGMRVPGGRFDTNKLFGAGIFVPNFLRVAGRLRAVQRAVRAELKPRHVDFASVEEERKAILVACLAGIVRDYLCDPVSTKHREYRIDSHGWFMLGNTVVRGRPRLLVGLPVSDRALLATEVDVPLLEEVAPRLVKRQTGLEPRYCSKGSVVVSTTQAVFFNGQVLHTEEVADGEHPQAAAAFALWLASRDCPHRPKGLDVRGLEEIWDTPECNPDEGHSDAEAALCLNIAQQARARELNLRAGREVFEVRSKEELGQAYQRALRGARRFAEITEPHALRLPALDDGQVKLVLAETPDTIELLGEERKLRYISTKSHGIVPRVTLSPYGQPFIDRIWMDLPDAGVFTPSGRAVAVRVRTHVDLGCDIDMPVLKQRVNEALNEGAWDNFVRRGGPYVRWLRGEPEEFVPVEYAMCHPTGEPLYAYGAWVHNPRPYSPDEAITFAWFRTEAEARAASCGEKPAKYSA